MAAALTAVGLTGRERTITLVRELPLKVVGNLLLRSQSRLLGEDVIVVSRNIADEFHMRGVF